ncbi:hypothetical protein SARC_05464 [Sphaeroforma arctica JP610]|uniref:ERCC1-like central domain-containing protein n=1 Tax=Sphaeroforma arctica JP610 TaxID=667725 RepID=A0A0L0FZJ5_9EUKA|nr:hypothetical protein SARC_05464 [Sphaeroforma arctica JP610]KNC82257.1 hypothetical protein SARC_05464 [Sphaeroforma arctica JP610]|eukprot:XP_014156159.1 hypothetical protein SARC_05464 [Sphaeroforma arctica JP610]
MSNPPPPKNAIHIPTAAELAQRNAERRARTTTNNNSKYFNPTSAQPQPHSTSTPAPINDSSNSSYNSISSKNKISGSAVYGSVQSNAGSGASSSGGARGSRNAQANVRDTTIGASAQHSGSTSSRKPADSTRTQAQGSSSMNTQPTSASNTSNGGQQTATTGTGANPGGSSTGNFQQSKPVPVKVRNINPNAITVNQRQKGNPILKHLQHTAYEYGDCLPDYHISPHTAIMYLSMRFHLYRSNYIGAAVRSLGRTYTLRVLLLHIDVEQYHTALVDLTKLATLNGLTLICAWSPEEAARYIETFKRYENKNSDLLQEKVDDSYLARATGFLTEVNSVNSTDVITLLSAFGSIKDVVAADHQELAELPGVGDQKIHRIYDAFRAPFVPSKVPEEAIQPCLTIAPTPSTAVLAIRDK